MTGSFTSGFTKNWPKILPNCVDSKMNTKICLSCWSFARGKRHLWVGCIISHGFAQCCLCEQGVSKFHSKSNVLLAEILWLHHFEGHQLPSCSLDPFYQNIYQLKVIFMPRKLVAILVFTGLISPSTLVWWVIRWSRLVSFYFNWMTRGRREIAFGEGHVLSSVIFPSGWELSCPSAGWTAPAQLLTLTQDRVFSMC